MALFSNGDGMTQLVFPYTKITHPLFGHTYKPQIRIELYSIRFGLWFAVDNVLADTGADISVIPWNLGQLLVQDIESGIPIQLGQSISEDMMFNAYLHQIPTKIGHHQFDTPIAISMLPSIPPIFGRLEALDRFVARFVMGKELILE